MTDLQRHDAEVSPDYYEFHMTRTGTTQSHPNEVLVDHVTVGGTSAHDGVRVDFYHHQSFSTPTETVYRLRRADTGAERMVSHPKSGDPIKPALARRALAEWFVSYPGEALDALETEGT